MQNNLGPLPPPEQWDEWLAHPCTKRLRYWAEKQREELKEKWAAGDFSAAFDMEMAVKNAGATGACSVYVDLIDPNYEQIVIGASDEGEVKQNGPEASGASGTSGTV